MHQRVSESLDERAEELRRHAESAARRQTRDAGVVEDSGSHAMEALLRALAGPRPPAAAAWRRYVRQAAENYARDRDRRLKREPAVGRQGTYLPAQGKNGRHGEGDTEPWAGHAEFARRLLEDLGRPQSLSSNVTDRVDLERALTDLSRLEVRLLVGKYIEGLSAEELGAREGIGANAVHIRLTRIKQRLRHSLGESST